MDPSLRHAIRIAEAERTDENKAHVWTLLRRLGLRSCNCENSKCPVCRAQGCVRPEDITTKVDYVGSLCEKCILHMPIVYHGNWDKLPGRSDVVCRCYWCQEIDKWAGYTVAKSNLLADTSLVFIAIAKPVGEWKEFYTWPLFDQYKQAIGESRSKARRRNPDENINELERAFRYHPLDPEIQQKYVTVKIL